LDENLPDRRGFAPLEMSGHLAHCRLIGPTLQQSESSNVGKLGQMRFTMAQRRIKREDERMTCVHVNHGADVNLPGDPAISEDRFEQVGAGMSVTCPIFI